MCPEKQMLSVYFDGEMPSPWKEKMEAHIESCDECKEQVRQYESLDALFYPDGSEEALMEAAKERVWRKLAEREEKKNVVDFASRRSRILSRSVTVPFPFVAAAAAALIVLVFSLILVQRTPRSGTADIPVIAAETRTGGGFIVPSGFSINEPEEPSVSNMSDVLRYLENDDSSDIVIIKLPERKSFSRSGDPIMINTANYSEGTSR
ncbi:hypothetical protein AGMMS50212_12830 [Spirochaetia bacterium]|nr:hypothetical protein AGMMS50212_12830 [Spirochaetia bacterium]